MSNTLDQLIYFMLFSSAIAVFNLALIKVLPSFRNWSQYWLVLLLMALLPLLPISFAINQSDIPLVLLNALHTPTQLVANLSQPLALKSSNLFLDFSECLLLVLALGSGVAILRYIVSNLRVKQLVDSAEELYKLDIFSQSQRNFIEQRSLRIYITAANTSPFVWGLIRTRLVIPKAVFNLPRSQFQLLIDHEISHIQRGDQRTIQFFRFCTSLFWFNPFIAYIEKHFVIAMELNCDAEVINRFPNLRHEYARALVASLRLSSSQVCEKTSAQFSGRKASKSSFEERIKQAMMLNPNRRFNYFYKSLLLAFSIIVAAVSMLAQANVRASDDAGDLRNGVIPVAQARISSRFGAVNKIRDYKIHQGIDLVAPKGSDVVASYDGHIIVADNTSLNENYGLVVLINHGNAKTLYAHLDSLAVNVGDRVRAGQRIGTLGNTGNSTGPHVHFELIKDGQRIDPITFIK